MNEKYRVSFVVKSRAMQALWPWSDWLQAAHGLRQEDIYNGSGTKRCESLAKLQSPRLLSSRAEKNENTAPDFLAIVSEKRKNAWIRVIIIGDSGESGPLELRCSCWLGLGANAFYVHCSLNLPLCERECRSLRILCNFLRSFNKG